MSKSSKLFDLLAVLGTSAVALGGCGASPAPVAGSEVPAATAAATAAPEAPAPTAAATAAPAAPTAAAPTAKPTAAPAAPMPKAADMPKSNHTVKVSDSKRTKGCEGGCGEGTCGDCK